jgi:two-component system cell cycle response regulator
LERLTETQVATPNAYPSRGNSSAYLVHLYPTGPGLGSRHGLNGADLLVGRDQDCHICLHDKSVSRHHARIQREHDGYFAIDLGSKNGTYVNDVPVSKSALEDGDYLRLGCSIFRFLAGDNVESQYYEEIHRLTIVDALTGAYNKRYLLEYLDRELLRAIRHQRPMALIMLDIDHFKSINDQFGHLAGDLALREMAGCIRESIRQEEFFARYGGEEFVLVLPEETLEGAARAAERLRERVAAHSFLLDGQPHPITISLGVACRQESEGLTPLELIERADEKLYLAKQAGRNCVKL